MQVEPQQFKAFILDSGLITLEDFENAEKEAKKKKKGETVKEVLVSQGKISENDLFRLQAYILGIPFVNLEQEKIDFKVLSYVPEPIARSHNIIAFRKSGATLEVAMLDPVDLETIDFIKKKSNLKVLPRLTTKESITNALKQYHKSLKAELGDIIKKESSSK